MPDEIYCHIGQYTPLPDEGVGGWGGGGVEGGRAGGIGKLKAIIRPVEWEKSRELRPSAHLYQNGRGRIHHPQ